MRHFIAEPRKLLLFAASGACGGVIGAVVGEVTHQRVSGSFFATLLTTSAWTALIATGISLALIAAQSHYLAKVFPRPRDIAFGTGGAIVSGVVAGFAAQLLFGIAGAVIPTASAIGLIILEATRLVAWSLMGGLMGIGLSFCIPNFRALRGLAGGAIGAGTGGLGFVVMAYTMGDLLGRWLGAAIIGACLGAMLAWIETAFREAWLELEYGPKERRTVSLGKQAVVFGSDRERCIVYLPSAPPVLAKYVLHNGQILFEEPGKSGALSVAPGDRRTLGRLVVTVCTPTTGRPSTTNKSPTGVSLRVNNRVLPLFEAQRLTALDLGLTTGPMAPQATCAEVARSPADPQVFGLKNLTRHSWQATLPNGQTREVEPGKSVKLSKGTRIAIAKIIVVIE